MHHIPLFLLALSFALSATAAENSPANNRTPPPGRPVKVAAIAIGIGGDREAKTKLAVEHLEAAGKQNVDIACLPEEFAGFAPEPLDGPTVTALAVVARKHKMYVVCPIRERANDGKLYNTAVLLDRQGQMAGFYRKVYIYWGEDLHASEAGVKTFDTDFGRIAILICFDANFDELWQQAERQGAELVLWPSGYGGGLPLNGYAMIHNYPIVAVGRGNMIDLLGRPIPAETQPLAGQSIATIDLDATLVHKDFNREKVAALLRDQAGAVTLQQDIGDLENWFLLRAVKPGVQVQQLCQERGIETLRQYRQRSRQQIDERRTAGQKINLKPATE